MDPLGFPSGQKRVSHPPRFKDIAERAGVAVSTVDRVLNERGSVSEDKRRKVLAAAEALGINRILPNAWHGTCRIEVILPRNRPGNETPFWAGIERIAQRLARTLPPSVTLHRTIVPEDDVVALREAILHPRARRDVLIIGADSDPEIRLALQAAMARDEYVGTIVTEVPELAGQIYGGIDNRMMGRTAGQLMNQIMGYGRHVLQPSAPLRDEVLVLRANTRRAEHHHRVEGFLEVIHPSLTVTTVDTQEVSALTRTALQQALLRGRLAGIYATGHTCASVAPLIAALDPRPVWIGHECTPAHQDLLRDQMMDFVLDQDPEAQLNWSLLRALIAKGVLEAEKTQLRPPEMRLYCATNLPESRGKS